MLSGIDLDGGSVLKGNLEVGFSVDAVQGAESFSVGLLI